MRRYFDRTATLFVVAFFAFLPRTISAQDEKPLAPVGRSYALTNATIIQAPGRKIEKGTVVMKDGLITAVGPNVPVPADAITIKGDSLFVYAGFIDGLSRTGVTKPKEEKMERPKDPGNPPAEKAGVTPQNDVRNWLNPNDKSVEEFRNLGFTVSQVVPYGNFLPGSSAIVLLGGKSPDDMVLVNNSALYSELSGAMGMYPNTVMAVMAKWRELYRNASLNKSYAAMYASNRNGITRPVSDRIFEAFYPVIDKRVPVLFKSERVMETQRIFTLKNDLDFNLTIADVKEGWPIINKIKSSNAKVFLSLDLPDEMKKDDKKDDKKGAKAGKDSTKAENKKTDVKKEKTSFDLEKEALENRKKESIGLYVSQASTFNKAGVEFGFAAVSAKTKDIQANLRRMITAGLSEDAALAALTTSPAKLLGLNDRMGTVDKGMMANLVVSDKPYFNEKAKVRYVFVDGAIYKVDTKDTKKADTKPVVARGTWTYTTKAPQGNGGGKIVIKEDNGSYSGKITPTAGKDTDLKSVVVDGTSLSFSYDANAGSSTVKIDVTVKIDGDSFDGKVSAGQEGNYSIKATRDPKSN